MTKTLFVSDLDGTLLDSNAKITLNTAEIINKLIDSGLIFTYATARSFVTASRVASGINFKYPALHHNGVFIQDPKTGEYLDKCIFDREKAAQLLNIMRDNRLYPLVYASIDGRERVSWIAEDTENNRKERCETPGIKFYLDSRKGDPRLRPVQDYSDFIGDMFELYEIVFIGESHEELEPIVRVVDLCPHFEYNIIIDSYKYDGKTKYWLEITRFDATKGEGVKKLQKIVGADRVVCFGDNFNDIPMFNVSDESYAVENALPEVRELATDVIGSNDADGVARWLLNNITAV